MLFSTIGAEMIGVFVHALFPLIFFCLIGVAADRYLDLDQSSLSRLLVYVFFPPLVFSSLMKVQVSAQEVFRVIGFTLFILGAMAVLGWVYSRMIKLDANTTSSAVLAITFFNGVNLGFPMALFAFGEDGLYLAGVLIAVNCIPHNGFGMLIAARGACSPRQTMLTMVRMPFIYVIMAALLIRLSGISLPSMILESVHSLGKASIPLVLICVGMEMRHIKVDGRMGSVMGGVVLLRLVVAPLVAYGATEILGLTGLLQSVLILQASMPSAMAPIVFARAFGGNVEFISGAVFCTTICSLVTLPIVLILLKQGL
ncbi:MAG TPA: AEC family transporter [Verrucomicrobiales bacterium]|nr:AEC family transporter [Verrucomicrobiales bacterium]